MGRLVNFIITVAMLCVINFFLGYAIYVWFNMTGNDIEPTTSIAVAVPLTWAGVLLCRSQDG